MIYKSLKACVDDLRTHHHLIDIEEEVDPNLEMAEIQRRIYLSEGPAIYFKRIKGSPFPAVSNLFGTVARARFIFRKTLERVKRGISVAADPSVFLKTPWKHTSLPITGLNALPQWRVSGPVLKNKTTISMLPQIKSWPDDGGPFILLPQVYTENPEKPGILNSNLGMYRIQLGGNTYEPDREIGLHYQIRRDIGIHHTNAIKRGEPLKVSIFIGGPPAHTFSAVMPLPEGLPEIFFAGALSGRGFRYTRRNGFTISLDADFCITGTVMPNATKPEGPFGDHLGYYSLTHDFPYLKVENVYHRPNAIWPFTIVGRPPQEDTCFGNIIHEITGPMVPVSIPGVEAVHAVDAAGVHPLLLAIGRERYVPYREREPMELLTLANAILGFGHCSLAKFLFISALEDNPDLDINHIPDFFSHILERVDWERDLHFQTRTTIDTLDYSGTGLNRGSKVVIAAAGSKKRALSERLPDLFSLPPGFKHPLFALPGILMIESPEFKDEATSEKNVRQLVSSLKHAGNMEGIPLIVLTEDTDFSTRHINNFLWTTFTRANPSHDIHGVDSFISHKHWGCRGPLIIDARLKPHHTAPLIEDPDITRKVDRLFEKGGSLYKAI